MGGRRLMPFSNESAARCGHEQIHFDMAHGILIANVHTLEIRGRCLFCNAEMIFRAPASKPDDGAGPMVSADGTTVTIPFLGAGESPQ